VRPWQPERPTDDQERSVAGDFTQFYTVTFVEMLDCAGQKVNEYVDDVFQEIGAHSPDKPRLGYYDSYSPVFLWLNLMTIERFRSYLIVLARMQLDARPRAKIDASDVVQQTLMEAHAKQSQFTGEEPQLAAWLRRALANNIRDALRRFRSRKRDAARERSLEDAIDASSAKLGDCLAGGENSPSFQASRTEDLVRLADALLELPDGQREAVTLHHLNGWPLSEVAEYLGRTDAAVAGLLHRGLKALRETLSEDQL
jgi:RNA polymerase sigma-70 factor (ECF subfamily)